MSKKRPDKRALEKGYIRPPLERNKIIAQNIKDAANRSGYTITRLLKEAGLGKSYVWDLANGRSTNPGENELSTIERILGISVRVPHAGAPRMGYAPPIDKPGAGESVAGYDEPQTIEATVPLVGTIQDGAFVDMEHTSPWLADRDFPRIDAPRSKLHSKARRFAMTVVSDDMNASERPEDRIYPGLYVHCIDMADANIEISDNHVYLIRRRRMTNDGPIYGWALRRARVYRDRIELIPESTSHHETFVIGRDDPMDDSAETAVVGLVYGAYRDFGG